MKLREKIKRFWTLDVHDHEGFTLVELIIVIAILAILSSVAVVGYSSYVKKANIQADETLIAEVQNSLLLAYYNGTLQGNHGYVILTTGAAGCSDAQMQTAMNDAFGAGWENNLKLKHTGWSVSLLKSALNNMYADFVNNSSYVDLIGTDKLLSDVQGCASSFAELLVKMQNANDWTGEEAAAIVDGFLGGTDLVDYLENAGYEDSEIDGNVLANATVFGVASAADKDADAIIEKFHNASYIMNASSLSLGSPNVLSEVAHTYAAMEALIAYLGDPYLQNLFNGVNSAVSSADQYLIGLSGVCDAIMYYLFSPECPAATLKKAQEYYNVTDLNALSSGNTATSSPAMNDGKAYVGIMGSLNEVKGDYHEVLGEEELFSTNLLNNDVNNYVAAATLAQYVGDANHPLLNDVYNGNVKSAVVIVFNFDNTGNPIITVYAKAT